MDASHIVETLRFCSLDVSWSVIDRGIFRGPLDEIIQVLVSAMDHAPHSSTAANFAIWNPPPATCGSAKSLHTGAPIFIPRTLAEVFFLTNSLKVSDLSGKYRVPHITRLEGATN